TENDCRATLRGKDVGREVRPIDGVPEVTRLADCLAGGQVGIAGEVGARVAEGGVAQRQESAHVPVAYVLGVGIDIDREVEKVTDGKPGGAIGPRPRRL